MTMGVDLKVEGPTSIALADPSNLVVKGCRLTRRAHSNTRCCASVKSNHNRGEGELLKKRTDRGKVLGSGIKTEQPICDGWLRQSWAFFSQLMVGGKGAFALNSPTIIRVSSE